MVITDIDAYLRFFFQSTFYWLRGEESLILSSVGLILLNFFSPPKLGVNVEDKKEKIRENWKPSHFPEYSQSFMLQIKLLLISVSHHIFSGYHNSLTSLFVQWFNFSPQHFKTVGKKVLWAVLLNYRKLESGLREITSHVHCNEENVIVSVFQRPK